MGGGGALRNQVSSETPFCAFCVDTYRGFGPKWGVWRGRCTTVGRRRPIWWIPVGQRLAVGKIVYTYELREQDTGELYGEYISLNFCELPRLAKNSFDTLNPKEQWFHLLKNMRNFALNPKGVPERMKKVLEASRTSALPGKEQLQYFRAMISDIEKEDIATANYQAGQEDTHIEIAKMMLADKEPLEKIMRYSKLSEEQIKAL